MGHAYPFRASAGRDWETDAVANVDWHFPLFLAHGVTGIRNMNDGTADLTLALQVPGHSLHVELERLVEAGLAPLEALQTATPQPRAGTRHG